MFINKKNIYTISVCVGPHGATQNVLCCVDCVVVIQLFDSNWWWNFTRTSIDVIWLHVVNIMIQRQHKCIAAKGRYFEWSQFQIKNVLRVPMTGSVWTVEKLYFNGKFKCVLHTCMFLLWCKFNKFPRVIRTVEKEFTFIYSPSLVI